MWTAVKLDGSWVRVQTKMALSIERTRNARKRVYGELDSRAFDVIRESPLLRPQRVMILKHVFNIVTILSLAVLSSALERL